MKYFKALIMVVALMVTSGFVYAHHSVAGAFGRGIEPTNIHVEGTIVKVEWANPHIYINIEVTGGDVDAGQKWRLLTHPVNIMQETYGFYKREFNVGDTLKVHGWKHLRGYPVLQARAIGINSRSQSSMPSKLR